MKIVASNKKAYFNFEILEQFEAGIILEGWEVKSIKGGRFDIGSAYVKERKGELYLLGSNIPPYIHSSEKSKSVVGRDRKLLLHRSQISKILVKLREKGVTIVPLEAYVNDAKLIKIKIGLVRGRKKVDKRARIKERDLKKHIEHERKKYNF